MRTSFLDYSRATTLFPRLTQYRHHIGRNFRIYCRTARSYSYTIRVPFVLVPIYGHSRGRPSSLVGPSRPGAHPRTVSSTESDVWQKARLCSNPSGCSAPTSVFLQNYRATGRSQPHVLAKARNRSIPAILTGIQHLAIADVVHDPDGPWNTQVAHAVVLRGHLKRLHDCVRRSRRCGPRIRTAGTNGPA